MSADAAPNGIARRLLGGYVRLKSVHRKQLQKIDRLLEQYNRSEG
jgi:hypothetical protein